MKKTTFIQLFATIALGGAMITACSGDDGDTPQENYGPQSCQIGTTGKVLAGISNLMQCTYSADGVLQKAVINDGVDTKTITINGNVEHHEWQSNGSTSTWNYSYNKQGYVTKMEFGRRENDSRFYSYTYTYSGDRLTGVKARSENTETGQISDKNVLIEWQNGRIIKVTVIDNIKNCQTWNGEDGVQTSINTFTYPSTPVKNIYAQPTLSFVHYSGYYDSFHVDMERYKAMLGQFGKGMTELPSRVDHEWKVETTTGGKGSGSHYATFSYGLNSDGTIAYETINGTKYNYNYADISSLATMQTALPDILPAAASKAATTPEETRSNSTRSGTLQPVEWEW